MEEEFDYTLERIDFFQVESEFEVQREKDENLIDSSVYNRLMKRVYYSAN